MVIQFADIERNAGIKETVRKGTENNEEWVNNHDAFSRYCRTHSIKNK